MPVGDYLIWMMMRICMANSRIRMANIGLEVAHKDRNKGMGIAMYNSLQKGLVVR